MARPVGPRSRSSCAASRAALTAYAEGLALAALILLALLVRVVWLDRIEPNILPDEADHLSTLYRVMAGFGPDLLDLSWDGNPAASLYPALLFLQLLGPSYVSLRLSTAFGSLLTLVVFYLLARRTLSPFASLGATVLLAFSSWYLFFSRNGEVNVWATLCLLAAAYWCRLALDSPRLKHWILAGVFCGLGWYTYLSGVLILPTMLLYLSLATLLDRTVWKRALVGSALLALTTLIFVLPRLPILLEKRSAVELYVADRSVLRGARLDEMPSILAGQTSISLRAFVLMDSGLPGNARYIAPGAPVFDPMTAVAYLAGLVLSLRRFRETLLWWCLFAPIVLVVHSLTTDIPDGARALPALPAMMLFAGLGIERARRIRPAGLIGGCIALLVLVAAHWNWDRYVEWQSRPLNAAVRQPAVELDEFGAWQQLEMARVSSGLPGFTVDEWHRMRRR